MCMLDACPELHCANYIKCRELSSNQRPLKLLQAADVNCILYILDFHTGMKHKRIQPNNIHIYLPSCFLLALSHIAGLMCTFSPFSIVQSRLHTRTPRQDFFNMLTLWLLVFLMAQPEECLRASSRSSGYTYLLCPVGHSS